MLQNLFLWEEPEISITILLPNRSIPSNFHPMVHYITRIFLRRTVAWLNSIKPLSWRRTWNIDAYFSRYKLFLFRQTSVSWNTKERRPPQFLQSSFFFSYNFHRMDLEVFCYSSSIIWNKNKFWKLSLNSRDKLDCRHSFVT